ncbi:MAG TPA: hypothetical protein VF655_00205, partial [Allosphingosinicella sp.]
MERARARRQAQEKELAAAWVASVGEPEERRRRAASADILGRAVGLPGAAVEQNYDRVKHLSTAQRQVETVRNNPRLLTWMSDPRRATVAADDVDALNSVSAWFGPNSTV